jgi:hypothetical protein
MASVSAELQQIYMVYMNRPADPAGLAYWEQAVANGATLASIAAGFAASSEFRTPIKARPASSGRVVYQNLFGRSGDADGVAFWVKALGNGATLASIGSTILHAAQGNDAATIKPKPPQPATLPPCWRSRTAPHQRPAGQGCGLAAAVTDAASQAKASAGLDDFAPLRCSHRSSCDSPDNYPKSKGTVEITVTFSSVVNVDTSQGSPRSSWQPAPPTASPPTAAAAAPTS